MVVTSSECLASSEKFGTETRVKTELESEVEPETETKAETEVKPETETEAEAEAETKTSTKATAEIEPLNHAPSPSPTGFIGKMSEFSLVNSTLDHLSRVYTNSRDSSRIVQLGASTVEYSVKLVHDTFEPQLRSLDGYAGRQLERLENGCAYIDPRGIVLPTAEIQNKLNITLQSLKNAETYIDFLLGKLRNAMAEAQEDFSGRLETWSESVQAKEAEASKRVCHLKENINKEIVQTLKNVVELVNKNGSILPLPGQEALKRFLLSLPNRSTDEGANAGQNSRIVLLANDAVVLIKSLARILTQYMSWTTNSEAPLLDQQNEN